MTTPHISEPIQSMVPNPGSGSPGQSVQSVLQPQRPLDPRSSVEDYNRIMRDYTQRRMSTFADKDEPRGISTSSRASRGSHSSGDSRSNDVSSSHASTPTTTSGLLARQQQQQGGKAAGSGAEGQVLQNSMMGY